MYFISRKPLSVEDQHFLSPWAKWKYHGRFPFKFTLHVIIVLLCALQIMLARQQFSIYVTSVRESIRARSIDPAAGDNANKYQEYYVSTLDDLQATVKTFKDLYWNINADGLSTYEYIETDGGPTPIRVSMCLHNSTLIDIDTVGTWGCVPVSVHWHTANDFYPFDMANADLMDFLDSTVSISITYDLRHTAIWELSKEVVPYTWHVSMDVNMHQNGGRAGIRVTPVGEVDNMSWLWGITHFPVRCVLDVLLVLSALYSVALSVLAVNRSIRTFNALRRRMRISNLSERQRAKLRGITWESLPWRQKLRIFNLWFIISIIGNCCNIIAGVLDFAAILNMDISGLWIRFTIGMGAMLALTNLLRYFEFNKSYYMLVMTLRNGAPIMGRFLLSIMPIYLGFAFCGVALFSQYSEKFENFSQACVTLFAVLHGDVILETYDAIYLASPVISRAYMYTFVTLFICAVLNVFVHIVEESYEYARDVVFGHATAFFNDHDLFEEKVFGLMLKKHDRFSRKQRYKARTSKERRAWKQRMAEDSDSASSSSSSSSSETMDQAVQWVHERQMSAARDAPRSSGGSGRAYTPHTPTTYQASLPPVTAGASINDDLPPRPTRRALDLDDAVRRQAGGVAAGPGRLIAKVLPVVTRGRSRTVGATTRPDLGWKRLFHSKEEEEGDLSSFSASVVGETSDMGSGSTSDMDEVKRALKGHIDERFDEMVRLLREEAG